MSYYSDCFREYVGGGVVIVDTGEVIFKEAYGFADVEGGREATPQTNFRLASVTKQFTATAIMLLSEEGKLSLDCNLCDLFPRYPSYGSTISVRHLLNHTSGVPDYGGLVPSGTEMQLHDLDVLQLLLNTDVPLFPSGTAHQYSNSGYALLALIVELVSGRPFYRYIKDEIFDPLGMEQSVVFVRGLTEVPERAFGYSREGENWVRNDQSIWSAILGDGGIYCCLDDFVQWIKGLLDQQLLSETSYTLMYTPPTIEGKDTGYGFGWYIDTYRSSKRLHHGGGTRGFSTYIEIYPERAGAVAVLLNQDGINTKTLSRTIVDRWFADSK